MLINCPECNEKVSDKSEQCIHCGYPLRQQNSMCIINGIAYDLEFILTNDNVIKSIKTLKELTNCTLSAAKVTIDNIKNTGVIPKELTLEILELETPQPQNQPKCPTCNSQNIKRISATSKAVSVGLFGIFSQKVKKQFHCNSCSYEW